MVTVGLVWVNFCPALWVNYTPAVTKGIIVATIQENDIKGIDSILGTPKDMFLILHEMLETEAGNQQEP